MINVSILILNFNGVKYLYNCLKSIENINYPSYEVILIDNASTDGSVNFVKNNFPWVKIIVNDKNYGFCEGYNKNIKYAKGKYLVFLNNDTIVSENWLTELVNSAEEYQVDICGSKILFSDNPHLINHNGAKFTPIGSGFDINFGKINKLIDSENPFFTGSACGAAMLIKRETFIKLGGFDPDYFAYFEDLDLCWRAWLYGYKIMHIPNSIIFHKFGGSWGSRNSYLRIFLGEKNRLANILKNFELYNVFKAFLLSLIFDILRVFSFLIKGEFNNIFAIIKGLCYFIILFPKTLRKRVIIQKNRQMSDKELYMLGLISNLKECIAEYFRLEKLQNKYDGK